MRLGFKRLWARGFYYRRIILAMMIFAGILFIPFSIVSYGISQSNISKSIEFSNKMVLSQLNYSYNFMTDMIAGMCMDIFLSNNTQQFLYSQDFTYDDIINHIRYLIDTVVINSSSIDSIVLYNRKRDEWFSTKNSDPPAGVELREFIETQESIPRLQPLLRQITRNQNIFKIQTYVFSYFMYQFSDPAAGADSYVVINQNAGWFIDNLTSIQQTKDYVSSIYWVDDSGIIYRNAVGIQEETDQFLADDFLKNHTHYSDSTYIQNYRGKKYILSSIRLGSRRDYLIIIQKYDEVFRDLLNLRRDYLISAFIFLVVIVFMLIPFSRRIYSPVESLVNLIAKTDGSFDVFPQDTDMQSNIENEFEYLQNIYRSASELNKRLLLQSTSYEPIFEQYQLFNLVNNNTAETYEQFRKTLPDHWISEDNIDNLRVLLFKIDYYGENRYKFEKNDLHLFFSSVRTIIHNSLGEQYEFALFSENVENPGIIVHTHGDPLSPFIDACRSAFKSSLNVTVSISHSAFSGGVLSLGAMYRQAKEYLQYRFVFGVNAVIAENECRGNLENLEFHYPYELDENLISSIRQKNISQIMTALDDIKNALYPFRYTNIMICMMELVNVIIKTVTQAEKNSIRIQEVDAFYKKVMAAEFMNDFFEELRQYIRSALGSVEAAGENHTFKNISAILEFVQDNYHNHNLSSQMIGDYLGMSNRYIMFKFMEATGKSLNKYIMDVRMRKAADLLRNTDLPVNQIAVQIGIENDSYFYKLFKKVYNYTPREFSEKYRAANRSG
ncbi:hypothetical protein FACS1894147_10380 [Spirochaetia bacterium]|nr:hypothetical protein FACS1894147_10380 [Spirochaetia bacterium]